MEVLFKLRHIGYLVRDLSEASIFRDGSDMSSRAISSKTRCRRPISR